MVNRKLAAAGALALATGFSAVAMPADAARTKAPFSSQIYATRVGASPDHGVDSNGFPNVEEGSIVGIDGLIKVAGRTVGTIRQDCQLIDVKSPCRGVLTITKGRRRGVVRYRGDNGLTDTGYFGFVVTSATGAFAGATRDRPPAGRHAGHRRCRRHVPVRAGRRRRARRAHRALHQVALTSGARPGWLTAGITTPGPPAACAADTVGSGGGGSEQAPLGRARRGGLVLARPSRGPVRARHARSSTLPGSIGPPGSRCTAPCPSAGDRPCCSMLRSTC